MSVSTQQSVRKATADSHESKKTQDAKIPKKNFKELLKPFPVDEHLPGKNFFDLVSEEEEKECEPVCAVQNNTVVFSMAEAEKSNNSVTRLEQLSPALEAVFEKMASSMLVMSSSHEMETTLFLEGQQFVNSALYGTIITIREFSTAPKAFNVEIVSNPQAISLMDASKGNLLAAFQKGNFNFTVNRLDTYLRKDKEKEEKSDDEQ